MKTAMRGRHPAVGISLALGVAASACGANMQAVYEGDVRFEHCMALDLQPDVRNEVRSGCWNEWLDHYTYGQTRDRISHAATRRVDLAKP